MSHESHEHVCLPLKYQSLKLIHPEGPHLHTYGDSLYYPGVV